MERAGRQVLVVAAVVAAFIVGATVLILALGTPSRADWDPDTPEATLQAYIDAQEQRDPAAALALMTSEAQTQFRRNNPGSPGPQCGYEQERMLVVERVTTTNDGQHATITVRIESFSGSGISWDRSSWTSDVQVQQEDGQWRIADTYFCL